jgi:tetratricopeptide (TPR) repeat protein
MGDVQSLIGRYDEAIASFRAALARIRNPSPVTHARLERKVGTALRIKGAYEEASAVFAQALAVLPDEQVAEAGQIRLQIGQLSWRTGDYATARDALRIAIDIGTALDQEELMAEGLKQLGNVPLHGGDPREAVELFQRSRVMFERLEDLQGIADIRLNLAVAYGRMGRWDECLAELQAAGPIFERIGDLRSIGVVHNNIGELHRLRGDFEAASAAYQKSISISTQVGYASGVANALTGLGMARVDMGQIEQGRKDLLEAEARFAALGRSIYLPEIHRFLASAELALGNLEGAARSAERSLELAAAANAPHQEAMTQRVLGQIALKRGDIAAARRLLEASRQTLAEVGEAAELARTEEVIAALPTI